MAFPSDTIIKNQIRKINDVDFLNFQGFPENNTEVSERWAEVVDFVGSAVTPSSTTAAVAKTALEAHWAGGITLVNFPTGFGVYATALALGQLPTYTGVPPPVPIVLTSVYVVGNGGGSGEAVAAAMAPIISTWFKTGVAILVAPPNTPVPWT